MATLSSHLLNSVNGTHAEGVKVIIYQINPNGDKKNFFDFERGAPDGSTIDSDGFIWNCRWGGSCVVKIDPKGRVDQIYELPVENVTNCVFGGSDLKTLFITSATNSGKNQHDGSLFALNVNVPGLEDNKFKI